ncbi:MAG: cytochrome c peroxidase [Deltaproteobacteria bacterium]
MTRAIIGAGGLACLLVGMIVTADDAPIRERPAAPVARPAALQRASQPGNSPLPTQVWWTDRKGDFLVYESGPRRLTEFDSSKRPIAPTNVVAADDLINDCAVPAPNGQWSAMIDHRRPGVRFVAGDIRRIGRSEFKSDRVPDSVPIDPNPQGLAVTADSKKVLVACDTSGPADRRVGIIDVETGKVSYRPIQGSSNLRGIAVDPTGKYALAVHLVPKSHLPSTQIEQGWVFTNAITWLSLGGPELAVTLPLDLRTQGFANPEGVAISPNGEKAWVAHAGADVVSVVDLKALLAVVQEVTNKDHGSGGNGYVVDDLRMTRRYVRARIRVGSNPRAIAVSPDGAQVAVANRLDDSVSLLNAATDSVTDTISLYRDGKRPPRGKDAVHREGEKLFHSGRLSFSGQFSCVSCHPDGHADGLNWDLPADGFNNFHNTKSLLSIEGTAPYGWLGTSPTLRDRFTGTLRHLFQHEPTESEAAALEDFLVQLWAPEPVGPFDGATNAAVARGKALFEGKAGCRECHAGTKFTDRALHDVGTGSGDPAEFDTPTLLRISTTAPYLHDGRAATLEEIFAKYNPAGLHGRAADLPPQELADLVAFLRSL